MTRPVGFSVVFFDACPNSYYEDILTDMLATDEINAIELNLPQSHERVLGGKILELVRSFDYRAVHSQQLISPDKSSREIARCMEVAQAIDPHAITIHPDSMSSYGWLSSAFDDTDEIEDMDIEIEDMDISKASGVWPKDMPDIFKQLPRAKMTFDTQHCYSLGDAETATKAAHAFHNLGVPIGHYHLSGLGPALAHVGLDKVPKAQLDTQFSWLIDPYAPLIFETRGSVKEKDEHGVEYMRYDLTEWPIDLEYAKPYIGELAGIR